MKNLKVALVAACAVVVGWAFTASADIPASAYVQTGLIAQWDGIDNAGTGTHDANATTWKDLSGNGNDLTVVADKGVFVDGNALYCNNAIGCAVATKTIADYRTIEIVFKMESGNDKQCIVNSGVQDRFAWYIIGQKQVQFSQNNPTVKLSDTYGFNRIAATYASDDPSVAKTANAAWSGGQHAEGTYNETWSSCPSVFTIGWGTNENRTFKGRVYAVRLYNRELTVEEIAKNADVDRMRFLETPEDIRYQDGRFEYRIKAVASVGGTVEVGEGTEAWGAGDEEVVVLATPEEGCAFSRWTGDTVGLSETQLASPELTLSFGDKPRTLTAQFKSGGTFTSYDYSQNGLVAQWDGIDNAVDENGARCHDTEALKWPSLINASTFITLNAGAGDTVGEKSVTIVAGRSFSGVTSAATVGAMTVEICVRGPQQPAWDNIGNQTHFQLNNRFLAGYHGGKGVHGGVGYFMTYPKNEGDFSKYYIYGLVNGLLRCETVTNGHTFAAVSRMASGSGFFEGEAVPLSASAYAENTGGTPNGGGSIGNNYSKPEFYAIRVYNRELSEDEIRRHALIDRARFFDDTTDFKCENGVEKYRVEVTSPDGGKASDWYEKGETATLSYVPKTGETFNFWKHAPETADRTQNPLSFEVTKPLKVEARLVDRYRLTAASYVQDGLVLAYDGKANAGIDADGDDVFLDKAGVWKDLSPYGQDAAAYSHENKLLWHDGGCDSFAPGGYMVTGYFNFTGSPELVEAGNNIERGHTAQVVFKKGPYNTANCYANVVGLGWWHYYLPDMKTGLTIYERGVAVAVGGDVQASNHVAVTTTFTTRGAPAGNGYLNRWFGADNGKSYLQTTASMAEKTATGGNIFAAGYYDQPMLINSARFYNRVLDDYERMLNTRIDEERFLSSNATRIVSVESSSDNFGTPTGWDYGTYRVEPGSEVTCSFADSLEIFEDGVSAIRVADGERTAVTGYVVSNRVDGVVESAAGAASFAGVADDDFRLVWQWNHQYRATYVGSEGGAVSAAKPSGSWYNAGSTVTLTAVPDDTHKFNGWAGDTAGIPDLNAATIELPVDGVRNVTAVFAEKYHVPVELSWQGGATGRWSDPANWGGVLPQEGDTVTLDGDGDVTVSLDVAMPRLAALTVGKTLVSAGWVSSVNADSVRVLKGGVVTCAGGFGSMSDISNRVWIVCDTLEVENGGTIDVSRKGWTVVEGELGAGPGAGTANSTGGFYGGFGGTGYIGVEQSTSLLRPYGNAEDPRDPGSAGSATSIGTAGSIGGSGGGAVLVQATGAVTLNGTVVANGGNASTTSGYAGGGSGGGISVFCRTISGAGSFSARGGSAAGSGHGGNGSGGRIAVHYDLAAQAALDRPALKFDAGTPTATTVYGYESNHVYGEGGTVWLPDSTLLDENFNVTGQVMIDGAKLSLPSLTINGRRVSFTQEGFELTVAGDVVLCGNGSTLELGGSVLTFRPYPSTGSSRTGFRRFGGATPVQAIVGGNLTLEGTKSEVVLYAARLDYADADPVDKVPCGGLLSVGKRLTVNNNTRIVCVSHYATGVSPRIEAKNVDVLAGGLITANGQGYYARNPQTAFPLPDQTDQYAFGPGSCKDWSPSYNGPGGSHLGLGGKEGATIDATKYLYDDMEFPHMPGSGANTGGGYASGGGVIWLDVERRCRIMGTLTANGETCSGGGGHEGGCAGGAIFVRAHRLYLDPAGRVTANGAQGSGSGGAGGGGGAAFYRAFDMSGSAISANTVPQDLVDAGVVTVAAGAKPVHHQSNGTVYLGQLPKPGLTILVR